MQVPQTSDKNPRLNEHATCGYSPAMHAPCNAVIVAVMNRAYGLPLLPLFLALLGPLACGGQTSNGPHDSGADTGIVGGDASPDAADGGPSDAPSGHDQVSPLPDSGGTDAGHDAADAAPPPPPTPTSKVDVLFMVQNSASMAGVSDYLQASVQALFDRLLNPNCLDSSGNVVGVSSNGQCVTGALEFQPVPDVHVGIVTSSLGGRGGDQCSSATTNPANPALNAHDDDRGELINRTGATETALADASPSNFLAWFPSVPQNSGKPAPPVPPIVAEAQLVSDFQGLLADTGVHGCGFTAPLEAWYRFLVQPDPYDSITKNGTRAAYSGVDATILQQRHDFLRPDSAVAIVVVAVENDRSADPLSIGGQGWAFENQSFPGSPNAAAPEGTTICATNPEDPTCTSCAFEQGAANFATICPTDPPGGTNGYLDPSDDGLNVRFFHMKQRFGLDPQFPIARYVSGLTSATVPDSAHEHDTSGNYLPTLNCTNPLFAASLPTSATGELCALTPGARQPSQVFLTVIGGVPHQLLQSNPSDANSPQKPSLSASDWNAILGADPLDYDFTGADFHMLESETPRAGSSCSPTAVDSCDPINGREWITNKGDLQFACTYALTAPRDCTQAANAGACACATGALNASTPLCQKSAGGTYTTTQIEGQAYPTIRELAVARSLGGQAVVSSICPIHTTEATAGDPLYGYRPAFGALVDRLATTLIK